MKETTDMLVAAAVQLMLLMLTNQVATSFGQSFSPSCHIPAGKSSLAAFGRDAVRFNFSVIQNNVNYVLPNVRVQQHVYAVTNCGLQVYFVSETIQNPSPFLRNAGIQGILFFCATDTDPQMNSVYGVVLKMIENPVRRPEVIPVSWYSSANIILQLIFYRGFPANESTAFRCKLNKNVTVLSTVINVVVTANFSVQKVGCPKTHWGSNCMSTCFSCENGGECDTFNGRCWCPDEFTGTRCETRITTTSKVPLTTTTGSTQSGHGTTMDKSTNGSQKKNLTRYTSTSTEETRLPHQTTSPKQTTSSQQKISVRQTTSPQQQDTANQMTKSTSGHSGLHNAKTTQTLTLFYVSSVVLRILLRVI